MHSTRSCKNFVSKLFSTLCSDGEACCSWEMEKLEFNLIRLENIVDESDINFSFMHNLSHVFHSECAYMRRAHLLWKIHSCPTQPVEIQYFSESRCYHQMNANIHKLTWPYYLTNLPDVAAVIWAFRNLFGGMTFTLAPWKYCYKCK